MACAAADVELPVREHRFQDPENQDRRVISRQDSPGSLCQVATPRNGPLGTQEHRIRQTKTAQHEEQFHAARAVLENARQRESRKSRRPVRPGVTSRVDIAMVHNDGDACQAPQAVDGGKTHGIPRLPGGHRTRGHDGRHLERLTSHASLPDTSWLIRRFPSSVTLKRSALTSPKCVRCGRCPARRAGSSLGRAGRIWTETAVESSSMTHDVPAGAG